MEDPYQTKEDLKIGGVNLSETWRGAKRVDNWKDPFDIGAAAAAHTAEFLLPQSKEEVMFELATLGQGKKIKLGRKLVHAALKDIPIYQKGEKYVSGKLNKWFSKSRFRPEPQKPAYSNRPDADGLYTEAPVDYESMWRAEEGILGKSPWLETVNHRTTTLASPHLLGGSQRRGLAAELPTGQKLTTLTGRISKVGRGIEEAWTKAGQIEYEKIVKDLPILKDTKSTIHHPAALKTVAAGVNGLTPEAAIEGGNYIASQLKSQQALGFIQKGIPLPRAPGQKYSPIHNRIHALLNEWLGPNKDMMRYVEAGGKKVVDMEVWERKEVFDRIAAAINDADNAITAFYNNLNTRTNLKGTSREAFIDVQLEVLKYDNRLKQIIARKPEKAGGTTITITDIVNDIVGRANTALEDAVNLVANTSSRDPLYKIFMQKRGYLALEEALKTPESAASIFKKYEIDVGKVKIEQIVREVDPNKLSEIMPKADVDTYIQSGWADPREGSSSLKTPVQLSGPLRASRMKRIDIIQALKEGFTVIGDDGKPIDPETYLFPDR